jgi:uncharacterized protein (TIGR02001 family)
VSLGCVVLGFAPVTRTHAQESPSPVSANVGIFSQFVFRGLTQTARHPAVQDGFDYALASGVYAGTWLSNISWFSDTNSGNTAMPQPCKDIAANDFQVC